MKNPYEKTFALINNEHDIVMLLHEYFGDMQDGFISAEDTLYEFTKAMQPLIEKNLQLRIKGVSQ